MKYPKISIVTPSFNQGQYIEDTILSVLGQNYPNIEYLIIDGGSNDSTVEVIKKYENKINYWVSESDNGQSDAINKGFNKATGDILMWLNSDDLLLPNVLSFIAEKYQENTEAIFFGNCIHFEETKEGEVKSYGSNVKESFTKYPLELFDTIIQPSSFWSKDVWERNGALSEEFHFGFDWEWFLRAKTNNIPFICFNKAISMYRIHDSHKTGVGGKKRQLELLKIYNIYSKKYAALYDLVRKQDFKLTGLEKIKKKLARVILKKHMSKAHFLVQNDKNYTNYTVDEIYKIKTML